MATACAIDPSVETSSNVSSSAASTWKRAARIERHVAHSQRRGKLAPQHRVRSRRIHFFRQILVHQCLQVAVRARSKLLQIFGERAHVLIILRSVKFQ